MKSTDVKEIYNKQYFLEQVDGAQNYTHFSGKYSELYERYQRNIQLLGLNINDNLLEYGCGRGEVCLFHRLRGGKAVGVDYSTDAISLAREKAKKLGIEVQFFNCNFSEFKIHENSFDKILASEFIEHISKEECSILFDISYKALKPGGKFLIFTYPNTLQRKIGYRIIRFVYLLFGKNLPQKQPDMVSEHYEKYHLNEQSYFSLLESANRSDFKKITIEYDVDYFNYIKSKSFIKRIFKKIIFCTFLRHFFLTNIYMLAEK